MDGAGPSSLWDSIWDTSSQSTPVLGCTSVGVGCTPPRSGNVQGVVRAGEVAAHQSPGNEGLFLALQSFQELVAGHHVTAMCNNSTVVAYVNKQGGTVSRSLCSLASQLLRWSESRRPPRCQVSSRAVRCSGRSPQPSGSGYRDRVALHPRVVRDLLRCWGSPSIYLFAIGFNAKLPLYCSLVPDPQAVFEDA